MNKDPKPDENLPISDSNIKKRDLSLIPPTCSSLLPQIKSRIKRYNFETFSTDNNQCMSEKVSDKDVDDVFAFIVMKKVAQS